ncbi:DNA polymerase III subunit delta [Patescibacteria group bacterium]|nr:DNA polymerase III subunit delta [Patescibacteria group bacterium]
MLFFYYGNNSYLANQKIQAIVEKFKKQIDTIGQNVEYLDGENMTNEDFFRSVSIMGFLADKKLIIIKNIFDNKKLSGWQDALIDYIKKQKNTPDENYIIFFQSGQPDARTKLYKTLSKIKFCEDFKELNNRQLIIWVKNQAKKFDKEISDKATDLLINYVGNDPWQLSNEIAKLANYSQGQINDQAVSEIVQAKTDESIFSLIDALGQKDKAQALKLIEEKINKGVNHQYILTMIVRQFRILIKTKSLEDKIISPGHLSSTLKIHPLVANKTLAQSKLYDMAQLKLIYQKLLYLDEKFKSSQNQEKILFAKMINEL